MEPRLKGLVIKEERMQSIEDKVKNMLHATQLANIKATRQSHRDYLDGQETAFNRVLKALAEIKEEA